MKDISIIGTGHMGASLAIALNKNKDIKMIFTNRTLSKAENLAKSLNQEYGSIKEALDAKYIFLGVKPQQIQDLANEIKDIIPSGSVLVSMLAGVKINRLKELFNNAPIIRIMPNTPVIISKGMTLYTASEDVKESDLTNFVTLMSKTGSLLKIDEDKFDAATAVSGSGPAFVEFFTNAFINASNNIGINNLDSIKLVEETIIGTLELVKASDKSVVTLMNEVCSPGGSTIEGVNYLKENNYEDILIKAVEASYNKNKKLGNN